LAERLNLPKPVKGEKKKKAKPKKSPERKLIETIDDIDSIICLIVNDFKCILCGGTANQTHHYFHKASHGAVRFDPDNHCPMDFGCHNFIVHTKGDTEDLRDNLIKRISQPVFDNLKARSKQRADRSISYLKEELDTKLARLDIVVRRYPERLVMLSDAAKKRLDKYFDIKFKKCDPIDLAAQCHGFNGWK